MILKVPPNHGLSGKYEREALDYRVQKLKELQNSLHNPARQKKRIRKRKARKAGHE